MHLVQDEHGNSVAHGAHDHSHAHGENGTEKEKQTALLTYMLQHNQHHAAELEEMADALEKEGFHEAADEIRKGFAAFQDGNHYLEHALQKMSK